MSFPLSSACLKLLEKYLPAFDPPAAVPCPRCQSRNNVWTQKKHCKFVDGSQEPTWSQIGIHKRMCGDCPRNKFTVYIDDHGRSLIGEELELYKATYKLTMPAAAYTPPNRLDEDQPFQIRARYLPVTPKSARGKRSGKRVHLNQVSPSSVGLSGQSFYQDHPRPPTSPAPSPRKHELLARLDEDYTISRHQHSSILADHDILIGTMQVQGHEVERCRTLLAAGQAQLENATLTRDMAAAQLDNAEKCPATDSSRAVVTTATEIWRDAEIAIADAQDRLHAQEMALKQAIDALKTTEAALCGVQRREDLLWRKTLFSEGRYQVASAQLVADSAFFQSQSATQRHVDTSPSSAAPSSSSDPTPRRDLFQAEPDATSFGSSGGFSKDHGALTKPQRTGRQTAAPFLIDLTICDDDI